jgi:glycosyltransferase involved in cell wall biosynthesis
MKEGNPIVSILIPVYNREKLIIDTINCVLSQTYQNLEIIIVDNKSTDSTWGVINEIAKCDSRLKVFQNDRNLGPVLNWQECFKKATGEYCKILWSDDLISNNFIEKTLELMDNETSFVMSGVEIFRDTPDNILFKSNFQNKESYSQMEYLSNILIRNKRSFPKSPGCALFRTEDLTTSLELSIPNDFKLIHSKNGAGIDLLIFLNIAIKYPNVRTTKAAWSFFRDHKSSFSVENVLTLYYETAILYFIRIKLPIFLNIFIAKIFLKSINHKELKPLKSNLRKPKLFDIIRLVFNLEFK